jgi:hypothetical protein
MKHACRRGGMHIGFRWESQNEGRRPLGRCRRRCRWEENIKTDHRDIQRGGKYWVVVAQWRALVNAVVNLLVP